MSDGKDIILLFLLFIIGAYAGGKYASKKNIRDNPKELDNDLKKLHKDLSSMSDADLIKSITSGSRDTRGQSDDTK